MENDAWEKVALKGFFQSCLGWNDNRSSSLAEHCLLSLASLSPRFHSTFLSHLTVYTKTTLLPGRHGGGCQLSRVVFRAFRWSVTLVTLIKRSKVEAVFKDLLGLVDMQCSLANALAALQFEDSSVPDVKTLPASGPGLAKHRWGTRVHGLLSSELHKHPQELIPVFVKDLTKSRKNVYERAVFVLSPVLQAVVKERGQLKEPEALRASMIKLYQTQVVEARKEAIQLRPLFTPLLSTLSHEEMGMGLSSSLERFFKRSPETTARNLLPLVAALHIDVGRYAKVWLPSVLGDLKHSELARRDTSVAILAALIKKISDVDILQVGVPSQEIRDRLHELLLLLLWSLFLLSFLS